MLTATSGKTRFFLPSILLALAAGLATCLLIALFVTGELSYDKYNDKADRIYRLNSDLKLNEAGMNGITMPAPMGPALQREFPLVEKCARLVDTRDMLVKKGDETIMEHHKAVAYHIIGVVKDFHGGSLHDKIGPVLFHLAEERGAISFRINSKNIPAVIAQLEKKYHGIEKMAGQPFLYSFMDDDFNRLYRDDQRTGKIFISFAVLAIFIACLGLFGLVTYAAEQRIKEIGVRKVLGASVSSIVQLLSKDFLKLVLVATVIAVPFAWWTMNKWLLDFAYRTHIAWWDFAIAAALAAIITIATVCFRAISAARANPVKSLRSA